MQHMHTAAAPPALTSSPLHIFCSPASSKPRSIQLVQLLLLARWHRQRGAHPRHLAVQVLNAHARLLIHCLLRMQPCLTRHDAGPMLLQSAAVLPHDVAHLMQRCALSDNLLLHGCLLHYKALELHTEVSHWVLRRPWCWHGRRCPCSACCRPGLLQPVGGKLPTQKLQLCWSRLPAALLLQPLKRLEVQHIRQLVGGIQPARQRGPARCQAALQTMHSERLASKRRAGW